MEDMLLPGGVPVVLWNCVSRHGANSARAIGECGTRWHAPRQGKRRPSPQLRAGFLRDGYGGVVVPGALRNCGSLMLAQDCRSSPKRAGDGDTGEGKPPWSYPGV